MIVTTNLYNKEILLALIESVTAGDFDGPLVGAKIGLYTNSIALGPETVVADLTEAIFTTYARRTVTSWVAPFTVTGGGFQMSSALIDCGPTGAVTVGDTLVGYFVVNDETPGKLMFAEEFAAPINIVDEDSGLLIALAVRQGASDPGAATVIAA